MSETVELHQAFMWDCPACGRENFARAVTADLPRDEQIKIARDLGALGEFEEPGEDWRGDLVMAPTEVTCKDCGSFFKVAEDDQEDDSQ